MPLTLEGSVPTVEHQPEAFRGRLKNLYLVI
jgi:hypothetical protein